ncbi:MAG: M24 family metallopeptidase, partial [Coriobacteriia bacterium]|nr:M24 family metallopeptidase [Coriobacteriia bacterium]
HELPGASLHSKALLPLHAVITCEPGIYLPGELGVRIEDLVVVENDGHRNLSASPKELLIV